MARKIDLVKAMNIFMVVVDTKSFSKASGILNLATSAISKYVSELEAYYECKLLYRNTRSMHLTSEGERFFAEFKVILSQLDELKSGVFTRQNKVAGKLKITSPENAQGLGIDKKIHKFMQKFPEVQVSWLQQNRRSDLINEGIDIAIRAGKLNDSNLIARKFLEVDNLVVASPKLLKEHGTPKHPDELANYPCIIEVSNQFPWRWPYIENGLRQGVNVSGNLELDKGETVAYFASKGCGVARLPAFMMQTYLDNGELVPILQQYNTPPLEISMLYSHKRLTNPALNAFIEFVSQAK